MLPARPDCTRCDLHTSGCVNVGVPTVWLEESLPPNRGTPAVVFVGAYPSYYEDLNNTPFFQGAPAGALLRHAYIGGINLTARASIYLANAVRCRTGLGDPDPSDKQRKACAPHLFEDLRSIESVHAPAPLHLIALGSIATQSIFKKTIRKASQLNGLEFTLSDIESKGISQ